MMDIEKNANSTENKTTPASTPSTTPTPSTPAVNSTASTTPAISTLPVLFPEGYLKHGYHATTENGAKYLRTEYIEQYAKALAASLKGMKPAEFEKMLRELKKAKKRTLPYEARRTAAAELLPIAKNLVRHKKAPDILVSFISANLEAIVDNDTWNAFYRHCQAISGLMD